MHQKSSAQPQNMQVTYIHYTSTGVNVSCMKRFCSRAQPVFLRWINSSHLSNCTPDSLDGSPVHSPLEGWKVVQSFELWVCIRWQSYWKASLECHLRLSVCCVRPLLYVGQVDLLHSGSPLQTCLPLQLSVVAFPDVSWGKGGSVCPWSVYVWEWWAGSSSLLPLPLFSSPRSRQPEQLEHPHYIYDRAPPTSRLRSDGMWANAHSSSRGFSSCSCMNVCTGAIFQVLFVFTMHSLQCECSVMPLGHHMVNWMYMQLIRPDML